MTSAEAKPAGPPIRYKRSFKNYLIDSQFQLKYTGYIVLVSLAIGLTLGVVLWRTSRQVVVHSQEAVAESKKVSDLVKMSMKDDPIYGQNPELLGAFNGASSDSDKTIEEQQRSLVRQQSLMLFSLVGGLTLMVVLIGILGIYFTHKVAGPIYKMKMLLRKVGEGDLTLRATLRKGDELQEFFEAFSQMVEQLRLRQTREIEKLSAAIDVAHAASSDPSALAQLEQLRDEMKASLN